VIWQADKTTASWGILYKTLAWWKCSHSASYERDRDWLLGLLRCKLNSCPRFWQELRPLATGGAWHTRWQYASSYIAAEDPHFLSSARPAFSAFLPLLVTSISLLPILSKHYHQVSASLKETNSTFHSVHMFQAPVKHVHIVPLFIVTKISTTIKLLSHRVEYSLYWTGFVVRHQRLITKQRKRQNNIILYCSILLHCVDLTLCSTSCCLCASSVNIPPSSSLYCISLQVPD
jgi:hypothetical protein